MTCHLLTQKEDLYLSYSLNPLDLTTKHFPSTTCAKTAGKSGLGAKCHW